MDGKTSFFVIVWMEKCCVDGKKKNSFCVDGKIRVWMEK